MNPIPLFRAAHLLPYLEVLREIGAPVEAGLGRARLPAMPAEEPEAMLPLLPTLKFLTGIARREGIDDFASRARQKIKVQQLNPDFVNSILAAPTLHAALEAFCRLAPLEDSHLDVWMVAGAAGARVCTRERIPLDMQATRIHEANTNILLVAIVRAFAGPNWAPANMAFRSHLPLGRFAREELPNTRLLTGQKFAWIELPRSMLGLPPCTRSGAAGSRPGPRSQPRPSAASVPDFPDSLKHLLQAYLGDGYPRIELAAEIAGTSVRTLQRQLAGFGVSYSDLLQQARFEIASQLLEDPANKVIDVAYAVGYEDPAHFTRAFRRIAGVSPREYRRNQLLT